MALQQILDVTDTLNSSALNEVKLDVGGYDYAIVHAVYPAGTLNFTTTNDGGAVQGGSDGNPTASINYVSVQGTNLATGSGVTSLAVSGLVRFGYIGQYLRLNGTTVDKCIVRLFKIN